MHRTAIWPLKSRHGPSAPKIFLFALVVTTGMPDPCLLTTPPGLSLAVAAPRLHQTAIQGPNRLALHPDRTAAGRAARRLRNSRVPHAGPSKPSARAPWGGPVRYQLDARAASGQCLRCRSPSCPIAEPCRGPIQAGEVGNAGARVHPGSTSQTVGCSQHPSLRSSLVCLRSAPSSPARPV